VVVLVYEVKKGIKGWSMALFRHLLFSQIEQLCWKRGLRVYKAGVGELFATKIRLSVLRHKDLKVG